MKAKNIDTLLKDPSVTENLKAKLILSKKVLHYAEESLQMKTLGSYSKYAKLNRKWVSKIVVAAKKDSLKTHLFNFPIVGALPYKGFFQEKDAQDFAEKIKKDHLDVYIRPTVAFSSLGWWKDPLFPGMMSSDYDLIEVLFHELVHLNFYYPSQAAFNEAFATWFSSKASHDFINENFQNTQKTTLLTELQENLDFQKKMTRFTLEIQKKGKQFYSQSKNLKKTRKKYFQWIQEKCLNKGFHKKYCSKEWNNARISSMSTYLKHFDEIEKYSQEKKIPYQKFLNLLRESPASIVSKIISQENNE